MKPSKIRAVIVGCGNVAGQYAAHLVNYPHVSLYGCHDIDPDRAKAFAAKYGGCVFPSLDDVLASPETDLVINLTLPGSHAGVISACIAAGKHVHTEKPLALDHATAVSLTRQAAEQGVRLSSAPVVYLGEAQATAWELIRQNRIGPIRLVYAEVNQGRIETWHPNPESFYRTGVMWDCGLYPLTVITAFLGPVRKVTAFERTILKQRKRMDGAGFEIARPDFTCALLELEGGILVRLTANFFVHGSKQGGSIEFHSEEGRIHLSDAQDFGAGVSMGFYGKDYESVPLVSAQTSWLMEFARGVDDLATAILEDRPHRAHASHAAHIVEVLEAIDCSAATESTVSVNSSFVPPTPPDFSKLHPFRKT